MARLCAEARFCLVTHANASDAVRALNRELCRQTFPFFITFAACVVDPVRHVMTLIHAGHMPPLLRHASSGRVVTLGRGLICPPLGVDPAQEYPPEIVELSAGDFVLLYTDGISEAPAPDASRFGTHRVEACVARACGPQDAVQSLLREVECFTEGQAQEDDICVVAFGRAPSEAVPQLTNASQ
jgi:sigma-B regulation protein RsbU (phosphoserine phosphatase)